MKPLCFDIRAELVERRKQPVRTVRFIAHGHLRSLAEAMYHQQVEKAIPNQAMEDVIGRRPEKAMKRLAGKTERMMTIESVVRTSGRNSLEETRVAA